MMTPEELALYRAKLERVGRCLYSYGKHIQRWDDAPEERREMYRHMAHMSRIWWNGVNQIPIVFDTTEPKD